jgi:hypothetical protein
MMWPIIPDPINLVVATMHAIWPWLPTVTIVLRLITAFIALLVNVHHAIHEWRPGVSRSRDRGLPDPKL